MKAKEYTHKEVFPGKEKSGLRLAVFRARQGPWRGFPGSSAGKESACNAGNPSWIPELGRSPGERTGYPLQDSWASLEAQMVKKPLAIQEPWVPILGWEDPLEEGMVTCTSILAWRIPLDREA